MMLSQKSIGSYDQKKKKNKASEKYWKKKKNGNWQFRNTYCSETSK